MSIQPVTYRPITEIKAVTRKEPETAGKAQRRKTQKLARKPDKGQGENVDVWV